MSNQLFEAAILSLNPSLTIVKDCHEYGSNYGEVYRVAEIEEAILANLHTFFGGGGDCAAISIAWQNMGLPISWSQAITLAIVAEYGTSTLYIHKDQILTKWMRILATKGACVHQALADANVKIPA